MRIAVLGATGATGKLLVHEALNRGLEVVALARRPERVPERPRLRAIAADVRDPVSITRAVEGCEVLLSGLGVAKGEDPGMLAIGAQAVVASGIPRIVWLGAYGSGQSAAAAGGFTRALLRLVLSKELAGKVAADGTVLAAGGTVFHAARLTGGPTGPMRRTLTLKQAPRRIIPAGVSRATVAAAMVDEATHPRFPAQTVLPVDA